MCEVVKGGDELLATLVVDKTMVSDGMSDKRMPPFAPCAVDFGQKGSDSPHPGTNVWGAVVGPVAQDVVQEHRQLSVESVGKRRPAIGLFRGRLCAEAFVGVLLTVQLVVDKGVGDIGELERVIDVSQGVLPKA